MSTDDAIRRRAALLSHWYPLEWRSRYGDEFLELLMADLEERPRSFSLTLDVARSGLIARVAAAGLGGRSMDSHKDGRRSLAVFACAASLFVTVALAIWAQLTIGWEWSAPDTAATVAAMFIMTLAVATIAGSCLACVVPVLYKAVQDLRGPRRSATLRPLVLITLGVTTLALGTHHFANGWPGTGGHPWAHQGIVPGGVAAYAWASTLFISSYWLHPAALSTFPGAEVVWMVACPLASLAIVVGVAKLVRRTEFSHRILRFERAAGFVVAGGMALFLTGAGLWVFDGGPGPRDLFHIGAIDVVELAVLVMSLALAGRAVECTGPAARALSPH